MPDFKLVGAVAIKVRPDASKFREETQREIRKELAGYKADVKVEAKVTADTTEMKTDVEKAKKEAEAKKMTLKVGLDYDSVRAAQKQLEAAVKGLQAEKIKVKLDEDGIEKARHDLESMKDQAEIEMTFVPDEKGYRAVLAKINEIRRQKIEEEITFGWSEEELRAKEAEMKAALQDSLVMQIHYGNDRASIQRMLDEVNRELGKIKEITFDTKLDKESLKTTRQILENELARTPVEIQVNYNDQNSLKQVRDRLKTELSKLGTEPLKINFNEADLQRELARINSMIDEELKPGHDTTVRISYNNNRASIEKAIAELDAELAKIEAIKLDVELSPAELAAERAKLKAALSNIPATIEVSDDIAGYQEARAKLRDLLGEGKFKIETKVDEASLRAQLAIVEAKIKAADTKVDIKPTVSVVDYLKAAAALKILTQNQTVSIFAKVNDSSLLLAAAKLTGLRAAARWTQEFGRALGTLDRNLPIVAALTLGISQLTSGTLSLVGTLFSLGNGLGEVARMGGVLAPAMLLGLGSVMIVMKGVFKDFGAAIHGIDAAYKRLPPSGQEAADTFRKVFAAARESISKEFWDSASDSMLRFSKTALPAVSDGLTLLAGSLGGVFSKLLDSFSTFADNSGVKVFYTNMAAGLDQAQNGLADFMSGFLTLASVGSTIFPRMGKAFDAWAARFDAWTQKISADGTLQRWIDEGIQGLKDLGNIGGSLVKIWGNMGQAAQAAGALTLHSFAGTLDKLDQITAGDRFQRNLRNIFEGGRDASESFHQAVGSLGPALDVFSVTVKNTLSGAGRSLAAFIASIGDIISSPKLDVGLSAFLSGLQSMFVSLRPAAASIATIIQTVGEIMGKVATDSGPLFRNVFEQMANVLVIAWRALEPFLPGLIQIGTTIVQTLGPAMGELAQVAIPAFAKGIESIGTGLVPVIKFLSEAAVNVTSFLSELQVPTLVMMATLVLSLGGAFKLAAVIVPLATAAMKAFGIAAGITAMQTQLAIPLVGILLAALTGVALGGITALATSQQSATPYANEYADALLEDAKAADKLSDSVGQATTKVALKKLVDSGAYEAASKLGIGTKEVTDAVLKGGKAWDDIQAKIAAATDEYNNGADGALNYATSFDKVDLSNTKVTNSTSETYEAAKKLRKQIEENKGSLDAARESNAVYADAAKEAGIRTDAQAESTKNLVEQVGKTNQALGAAAAASTVLNDAFSSSVAKIDAMRKTFEILVGPNAKQQAAETLGAYAKGFSDLKDLVIPLAGNMRDLGDAAYGENGFLNVASGNKAVLQINQALIDEVNNVWAGAKAAYDAAIKQGDNAQQAFAKAQEFIKAHKGDYDQLATDSGLAAEKVQGQWDAVFGHDWVLKVSLAGATEAAATAQALVQSIKGNFDGQDFMAYLDANPDAAMLAVTDAKAAAQSYVDHTWQAQLKALPDPAKNTLQQLTGQTDTEWNRGNFMATLRVAQGVPGLAQALQDIRNGVGVPYYASIFAQLNNASALAVQIALNSLTMPRSVAINVAYSESGQVPVALRGQRVFNANGNILNGAGRVVKHFASGGIERHVAQITRPGSPIRVWNEAETHGEAYLPYSMAKRPRSVAILKQVAKDFGYTVTKADAYANGGITAPAVPTRTTSTSVTVGTINTVDPETAVRKLQMMQRDALAVAGIN